MNSQNRFLLRLAGIAGVIMAGAFVAVPTIAQQQQQPGQQDNTVQQQQQQPGQQDNTVQQQQLDNDNDDDLVQQQQQEDEGVRALW
jgi:uncharacterized protein HemX